MRFPFLILSLRYINYRSNLEAHWWRSNMYNQYCSVSLRISNLEVPHSILHGTHTKGRSWQQDYSPFLLDAVALLQLELQSKYQYSEQNIKRCFMLPVNSYHYFAYLKYLSTQWNMKMPHKMKTYSI